MKNRNSGIKLYRPDREKKDGRRGSLSLFILQTAVLCVLMILWWNAFLSVFHLPLHRGALYGGTAAAVLLLGILCRRFGARALAAGIAAAVFFLWYQRGSVLALSGWIGENYGVLFTEQPEELAVYSFIALAASVPVVELLLCVQRSGRGKIAAGAVLCAPFLTAACAGWFQKTVPAWLLVIGITAYFASSVPGTGKKGNGRFIWRQALTAVAVCSVIAFFSFQAGKVLDAGRENEEGIYIRTRQAISEDILAKIQKMAEDISGQEQTENIPEDEVENLPEPVEQQEEMPAVEENSDGEQPQMPDRTESVFDSPSFYEEGDTTNLNNIARFVPSEGGYSGVGQDEKPEKTVYVAVKWGDVYSDGTWNLEGMPPSEGQCREYPAESEAMLSTLCDEWKSSSFEEIQRAVSRELSGHAVYDTNPGAVPRGEDPLEYFLFENHRGFCVHFATAATLMYRYCGYAARYAEGYAVPPSAFHEDGRGGYVAQITGDMGHAWCQVYDETSGEWTDMEHTPPAESGSPEKPAASSRYKASAGEKIQYEILPVLAPVCIICCLCIAAFWGQAALRTARRRQKFRKKKGGEGIREMYSAIVKTAEIQGTDIKDPLDENVVQRLHAEYPEMEEKEWRWIFRCVEESMFYYSEDETNDWKKMRKMYMRFRRAALERMSRTQRWKFRYIYCL